jgi:hypothetical protein
MDSTLIIILKFFGGLIVIFSLGTIIGSLLKLGNYPDHKIDSVYPALKRGAGRFYIDTDHADSQSFVKNREQKRSA